MSEQHPKSAGFDVLLDELETMAKAMGDDEDENIAAAADDDAGDANEDDGDVDVDIDVDDEDEDEDEDEEEDDEMMGKSFSVQLADGTTADVFDGALALGRVRSQQYALAKSFTKASEVIASQNKMLKAQAKRIETLTGAVARLGDAGRGRKAQLTVFNKGGQPAAEQGIEPREFMAKALAAQKAGRITGAEVARAEAYIGRGLELPDELVSAVAGGN